MSWGRVPIQDNNASEAKACQPVRATERGFYDGSAHRAALTSAYKSLPGPEPKIYFAPVQIRKRNADWGHAVVNQRSSCK